MFISALLERCDVRYANCQDGALRECEKIAERGCKQTQPDGLVVSPFVGSTARSTIHLAREQLETFTWCDSFTASSQPLVEAIETSIAFA
jgi:hypothetical protein